MRLLYPAALWWVGGAALAALLVRLARQRRLGAAATAPWLFDGAYSASLLRRLPALVFAGALALVGVALMEPVLPFAQTEVRSHGLDIVIVLDLSSSMGERMGKNAASPAQGAFINRLDATKAAIRSFVERRLDDRIGLVVFSDNAYVINPLTFDHRALLQYIDMVDDQILRGEGMTAIGEGLAVANQLLSRQAVRTGAHNQVAVIFTDGENNIGREPLDVLAQSDAAGIRVHVVGVDLEREIRKKPTVRALVAAVTRYGGRYFSADTERELDAASREIDTIEKGVLVSQTYQRDAPVFDWFAGPALVCLALGFALRAVPAFIDQT
jgi:Ca-activated chloride channel family protein